MPSENSADWAVFKGELQTSESIRQLKLAFRFDYLVDFIPAKIVERFKLIYQDVDDVDLFIGGITETPLPGAIVGKKDLS